MSGFLNQKERVMDTIITQEGRSQLARFGKLIPTYYSFSDAGVVYDTSTIVSGSTLFGLDVDETYIPQLEASSNPYDTITIEKNQFADINTTIMESGVFFDLPVQLKVRNGELQAAVYPSINGGFVGYPAWQVLASMQGFEGGLLDINKVVTDFVDTLLTSSFNSFRYQQILKSPDPIDQEEKTLVVSPTTMSFAFSDTLPIENKNNQKADVDHIETIFWDKRLSHTDNYLFLSPIMKAPDGSDQKITESAYNDLSQNRILSFSDLEKDLDSLSRKGCLQEINFTQTSIENNLFTQVFENSNLKFSKLDIIDFGLFKEGNITKHVFFLGKLFKTTKSQPTFVNIFTFVYELAE